jgi:xanthine dehydrogenase accessory factor
VRSATLRADRMPFVHARVVLAERPTSAKPGDEAIVLDDGSLEGFVGGTCAESTVREQALEVLRSGEAMVLRITPVPEGAQPGKRVVHNPCLSGGTLEIFLEPSFPAPLMVVVGHAPIANALRSLGADLGFGIEAFDGHLDPDAAAVVVASHGRGEEEALVAALEAEVAYVGLVASARRGHAVVGGLDVSEPRRAAVHTPAGLDIGATTAEEVALSILAEIVASRPRGGGRPPSRRRNEVERRPQTATDPVCAMTVFPGDDTPHLDDTGAAVWFCGRGCLEAFRADPAAYRS